MTLSIDKLERIISSKGFIPTRYYIINKLCVFLEITSINDTEKFILYIPSKYKFLNKKKDNSIVHKIKHLDIDKSFKDTATYYGGKPDEYNIENTYREIDVGFSPDEKSNDIGPYLEGNYKRNISLKDISDEDSKEIQNIIRQLNRLKLCVKNVKYKIMIIYKNFMCTIKKDDSIKCYIIKNFPSKDTKKLFVTTDLESFYEKDSLILNMKTIRKGLYHILNKNHFIHNKTLEKILEEKKNIISFSNKAFTKKLEFEKYMKESLKMFEEIKISEKEKILKINKLNEKYQNSGDGKTLYNDINKAHHISNLEKELKDIYQIKEEVLNTIFDLKDNIENLILGVDNIMFDNNVMIECVLRNMENFRKICS